MGSASAWAQALDKEQRSRAADLNRIAAALLLYGFTNGHPGVITVEDIIYRIELLLPKTIVRAEGGILETLKPVTLSQTGQRYLLAFEENYSPALLEEKEKLLKAKGVDAVCISGKPKVYKI